MFFKYKMLSKNGYGNFLANFEKKLFQHLVTLSLSWLNNFFEVKYFLLIKYRKLLKGKSDHHQIVFYSGDQSWNPTEVYTSFCKNVAWKEQN